MNSFAIILLATLSGALLIFLIRQNLNDQRRFRDQLNRQYPHPREDEKDVEIEEVHH